MATCQPPLCLQTKRATQFLHDVFDYVDERVVLVVTHSGFTRSVLLAVGREPYRPQVSRQSAVAVRCTCITWSLMRPCLVSLSSLSSRSLGQEEAAGGGPRAQPRPR